MERRHSETPDPPFTPHPGVIYGRARLSETKHEIAPPIQTDWVNRRLGKRVQGRVTRRLGKPAKTNIVLKYGERRLNTVTLNIDDIRPTKRYNELLHRLETQKNRHSLYSGNTKRSRIYFRVQSIQNYLHQITRIEH